MCTMPGGKGIWNTDAWSYPSFVLTLFSQASLSPYVSSSRSSGSDLLSFLSAPTHFYCGPSPASDILSSGLAVPGTLRPISHVLLLLAPKPCFPCSLGLVLGKPLLLARNSLLPIHPFCFVSSYQHTQLKSLFTVLSSQSYLHLISSSQFVSLLRLRDAWGDWWGWCTSGYIWKNISRDDYDMRALT